VTGHPPLDTQAQRGDLAVAGVQAGSFRAAFSRHSQALQEKEQHFLQSADVAVEIAPR
jgi:hypothetical protein